jgi:hypothetical protein
MRLLHRFGRIYGWSKRDVEMLTVEEANYLNWLIDKEAMEQNQPLTITDRRMR